MKKSDLKRRHHLSTVHRIRFHVKTVLTTKPLRSCLVALSDLQITLDEEVKISFTLPMQYPELLPEIFLPIRSLKFPEKCKVSLLDHLNKEVKNTFYSLSKKENYQNTFTNNK